MTDRDRFRREYEARLHRAVDHVYENLGEPLRVEDLARAAHFSPYHFSRLFRVMTGESPAEFIARVRLERAASRLRSSPHEPVTTVALKLGFGSSAAFARAFKRRFGVSASEWRRMDQAKSSPGEASSSPGKARPGALPYSSWTAEMNPRGIRWRNEMGYEIQVKDMPEYRVACISHTGPYHEIGGAFQRLARWAFARGLMGPDAVSLGIYHDDPDVTPPEKLQSEACLVVPGSEEGGGEVKIKVIPAGRYAVMRAELLPQEIHGAWMEMAKWLPDSGFETDDRPCYELYLNNPKEHPEGKFLMELCEPVRPL